MSNIVHPNRIIPDEVEVSLSKLRETELATQALQDEIAKLARPTTDERKEIFEIRQSASEVGGINFELQQRLRNISTRKSRRVQEKLAREAGIQVPYELPPVDIEPIQPETVDPTFWWNRTDWWSSDRRPDEPDEGSAAHFDINFDNAGLRFQGGVSTHDGEFYPDSFGATALFSLEAERIPRSFSRLWRSTPHVELFGGLVGYTGDDDITTGDLWSKCWMHRSQQLFQNGFGADGPTAIIIGQAHESELLIFEEDRNRLVRAGLRGFQWMPPVTLNNINLSLTLWAKLEVRFDIQTEGAGSFLRIDPTVLLRTFQWALTAL